MRELMLKSGIGIAAILLVMGSTSWTISDDVASGDVPESDRNTVKTEIANEGTPWGAHRHWAGDENHPECEGEGKNCFDDYDVSAIAVKDLDDAIDGGITGIVKFFSNPAKWKEVFPELGSDENKLFLEKLQSGNYRMDRLSSGKKVMYVAKGGTPYEEFVFPVRIK